MSDGSRVARTPALAAITRADDTATMTVLLIGPRASGKSTVGRALAAALGASFVDLDDVVLAGFADAGLTTVEAVWAGPGESAWRRGESAALARQLAPGAGSSVIALGGGTPVIDDARARIRASQRAGGAIVVYLRCPVGALERRLREPGDRPSLTGASPADETRRVLTTREPIYLELADIVTDGTRPVASIVDDLVERMRSRGPAGASDHRGID